MAHRLPRPFGAAVIRRLLLLLEQFHLLLLLLNDLLLLLQHSLLLKQSLLLLPLLRLHLGLLLLPHGFLFRTFSLSSLNPLHAFCVSKGVQHVKGCLCLLKLLFCVGSFIAIWM